MTATCELKCVLIGSSVSLCELLVKYNYVNLCLSMFRPKATAILSLSNAGIYFFVA